METRSDSMNVKSIVFVSNDPEVLMKGTLVKGVMSYEAEIIISQTQLNMALNQLKRKNSEFSIGDYLSSEKVSQNDVVYFADFTSLENRMVDLMHMTSTSELCCIRA